MESQVVLCTVHTHMMGSEKEGGYNGWCVCSIHCTYGKNGPGSFVYTIYMNYMPEEDNVYRRALIFKVFRSNVCTYTQFALLW